MSIRRTVARYPSLKAALRRLAAPFRRTTSAGYRQLAKAEAIADLRHLKTGWKDDGIPAKQRAGVDDALAQYRDGAQMTTFDVFVRMLKPIAAKIPNGSLLEIGCSSGYYADVLNVRGIDLRYSGCDYSPAFIRLAQHYHPELSFDVEDATSLRYADNSFDIVVSGCCLLHIPEYGIAIAETARVTRRYALFHRTPVLACRATQFFSKRAYGVETVEIHFSESELVATFAEHGLCVVGVESISADWRDGDAFSIKSFLCKKGHA